MPTSLDLADLDAALIGAFLDHLEVDRRNGIDTRNLRLTAIRSLFAYAAVQCPEEAGVIQRVLAIPSKRPNVTVVSFLTVPETAALLAAPDRSTLMGRRDHALLLTAIQTGLRVSELTALRQRPHDPLFATRSGGPLSTDSVEDLVDKHVATATSRCPSLGSKRVTPHTLRHTCAMNLLEAGVDITTIALFLGHSSTRATEIYLHADLSLKERALARIASTPAAARRFRPPDKLLAFLESL